MRKINVGLIGFGNIGCGVVKILQQRRFLLAQKIGIEIAIKKICDKDLTIKRDVLVDKGCLSRDANEIINDSQIDIIVELIGGINPAKEFILAALKKASMWLPQIKPCLPSMVMSYSRLPMKKGKIFILRLL